MFDLRPATDELTRIVGGVRDDQLGAATPCAGTRVEALLDHVDGLCQAFTAAARREPVLGEPGAPPDAGPLPPDWRDLLRRRLDALAAAWADGTAWQGEVEGPGVPMPAPVAAAVALDEVLVHGWDLATATGQPFDPDAELVGAALGFVEPTVTEHPEGVPGLFGPAVEVPPGATPFVRLLALTGRDPGWRPGP